jgi:hypothetical protein
VTGRYNLAVKELFSGWRYAWSNFLSNWQFLSVVGIGVLVASILLAVGPIYASAMTDLGLRYRLNTGLETTREQIARSDTYLLQINDAADSAMRDTIDVITAERIGWLGTQEEVITTERSVRLFLTFPDYPLLVDPFTDPNNAIENEKTIKEKRPDGITIYEDRSYSRIGPLTVTERIDGEPVRQPWGAFLHTISSLKEHADLVEGDWPSVKEGRASEFVLPYGWNVHIAIGDKVQLTVDQILTDCAPVPMSEDASAAADEARCVPHMFGRSSMQAELVGFIQLKEPDDLRWEFIQGELEVPATPLIPLPSDKDTEQPELDPRLGRAMTGAGQMPLLMPVEQFFGPFAAGLAETRTVHRSGVVIDASRIGVGDVQYAIDDMQQLDIDIRDSLGAVSVVRTKASSILSDFLNQTSFSAVPLLIILMQVVGIVVYYVLMTSSNLLDRQVEAYGVFRSRGATIIQLTGFGLFQAMFLAIPAALIAPWAAVWVVGILGITPAFETLTGGDFLPSDISRQAYLFGILGAALATAGIMIPTILQIRRNIIDVRSDASRPDRPSFFQRYLLDFALLGIAGLLLWQIDQRGTVYDPDSVGGWSSDPVLLMAPMVIIFAIAGILLRIYPLLIRTVAAVLMSMRSLTASIGLRRAGRAPGAYARLMLLLLMAIAVGTFAASYGATVERSFDERQRYLAGIDFRGVLVEPGRLTDRESIENLTGRDEISDAAFVNREYFKTPTGIDVPVLGIDPIFASQNVWWRTDFALGTFDEVMRPLVSNLEVRAGLLLPDNARVLTLDMFPMNTDDSNRSDSSNNSSKTNLYGVTTKSSLTPTNRNLTPASRVSFTAVFQGRSGKTMSAVLEMPKDISGWVEAKSAIPEQLTHPVSLLGVKATDRVGQSLRSEGKVLIDDLSVIFDDGSGAVVEDFEESSRWLIYSAAGVEDELVLGVDSDSERSGMVMAWSLPAAVSPSSRVIAPLSGDSVPVPVVMNPVAMGYFGLVEVGSLTTMSLEGYSVPVVLVGVVDYFPTLDPAAGFVITDINHLHSLGALFQVSRLKESNELWLNFQQSLSREREVGVVSELSDFDAELPLGDTIHLTELLDRTNADPTLKVSGSGLLAIAFIAVLGLASLGFLVSMTIDIWKRTLEFAILRALGTSKYTILRALLFEWLIVFVLGAGLGVLLGRFVSELMMSFLEVTEVGTPVLPPFELLTDWLVLSVAIGFLFVIMILGLMISWLRGMSRADGTELRITQ